MKKKYLKLLPGLLMVFTLSSCLDWIAEPFDNVVSINLHNKSDINVFANLYGHEIGKDNKNVIKLHCSTIVAAPNSNTSGTIRLTSGAEWGCIGIWQSYGIDTLYVVLVTENAIHNGSPVTLSPTDDVLVVKKYTKEDMNLKENSFTVVYP